MTDVNENLMYFLLGVAVSVLIEGVVYVVQKFQAEKDMRSLVAIIREATTSVGSLKEQVAVVQERVGGIRHAVATVPDEIRHGMSEFRKGISDLSDQKSKLDVVQKSLSEATSDLREFSDTIESMQKNGIDFMVNPEGGLSENDSSRTVLLLFPKRSALRDLLTFGIGAATGAAVHSVSTREDNQY